MKKYILTGILSEIYILEGSLEPIKGVSADLSTKETIKGKLSVGESIEPYTDIYEVTPTNTQQVLYTKDKKMVDNVRVLPIPSNYGLITWNGSVLTVS